MWKCDRKPEESWSGRKDLNLRPLRPERSALPGCATPRPGEILGKESGLSYIRGSKRKPCASATPRQVTLPCVRFTPFAKPASARTAASTPEDAKVKR